MNTPYHKRSLVATLILPITAAVLLATAGSGLAATRTWTGLASTDSHWTNPANWSGVTLPQPGDDLVFPGSGARKSMQNTFPAGTGFRSLRFDDADYKLTGNAFMLTAGLSFTHRSGMVEIFCSITLMAHQTFTCDANLPLPIQATLRYLGELNLNGFNLTFAGFGHHLIEHSITGEGSSVIHNAGVVEYSNYAYRNTYTGTTTVLGQFMFLDSGQGFGSGDFAMVGPLVVGPSASSTVFWKRNEQVAGDVTVNEGGLLDMEGLYEEGPNKGNKNDEPRESFASLTLRGGRVKLGETDLDVPTITTLTSSSGAMIEGNPYTANVLVPGSSWRFGGALQTERFHLADSLTVKVADLWGPWPFPDNGEITKDGGGSLFLTSTTEPWQFRNFDLRIGNGMVEAWSPFSLQDPEGITLLDGPGAELRLNDTEILQEEVVVTADGSGSLLNAHGTTHWGGPITLNGQLRLEVFGSNSRFTIAGSRIQGGGSQRLAARNSGSRITFDGSLANTFDGATYADLGTIELMKSVANGAIPGDLTIGALLDPPNTVSVQLLPRPLAPLFVEQIADDAGVLVDTSGQLVVANSAETIGSLSGAGNVSLSSSRLTTGGNNQSTTFSGVISGSGGLTKTGTGTFRLTGANTYQDITYVNKGTLVVNGQQAASTITVETAGALGGTGRVGDLLVKGRLSPGESAGRLTCSDFAFTSNAVFQVELNGTTAGTTYDQLRVLGQVVDLANARLLVTLGFTPAEGATFVIIDNDGTDAVTNRFKNLPEGAPLLVSGRRMTISYQGGTGNDVVLTAGPLVLAGSKIWTGAVNGLWSVAGNWLGNVPPESGDDLVFATGAVRLRTTNDLPAGLLVDSITFERGGYGIAGNEFALSTALFSTNSGTVQANEIFANVELLSLINSHVQSGLVITTNILKGPGGLSKNGAGTLRLGGSGANTYLDRTLVQSGVLELGKSSGFAVPANTSIEIGQGFGIFPPYNRTVFVRHLRNNQMSITCPVTVNGTGVLDLNGFDDEIGALTLRAGAVQTGAGTLFLAHDVTASGAVVVGAFIAAEITGSLDFGSAARRFTVGPVINAIAGRIALKVDATMLGSTGFSKSGGEALRVNGTNTFTGAVSVEQGLLVAANSFALGTTNGGVSVSGSGTLELSAGVQVGREALTLNRTTTSPALQVAAGSASWAGPVTLAQNGRIRVLTNASLTLSGGVAQPAGTVRGLVKDSPGTLELAARSTFTGMTSVEAGILRLNDAATGTAIAGDLTVGAGLGGGLVHAQAVGIGQINSSSRVVVNGDGFMDWSGLGSGTEIIGSIAGPGQIYLGAARLVTGGNNDTTSFDGYISGTGGITKQGTGRFTLTGPNTYSGLTVVNAGELRVNGYQPFSPVSLTPSGILTGIGAVGAVTGTAVHLAPGADLGKLTANGNLVLSANDVFHVQIRGTNAGPSDLLEVFGTCQLSNATLHLDMLSPLSPGQRIVILRNDGADAIQGRFKNLPTSTLCTCAGMLSINYQGGDGNDIEVQLTAGVCSFPVTDLRADDNEITLCWDSIPQRKYRIDYSPAPGGVWFPLVESITATSTQTCHSWPPSDFGPPLVFRVQLICD